MGVFNRIVGGYSGKDAARPAYTGFNWAKESPLNSEYLSSGASANNAIASLLGLGGDPAAQEAAFARFRDSSGYRFQLDQGMKSITSNNASKGLLNSGAALKALTGFGQGLANTSMSNYLQQLLGLSQGGLQAGNIITGAGTAAGNQASNAISSARASDLSAQSSVGSSFASFSDKRIKTDIRLVREDARGLNWYEYRFTPEAQEELGAPAELHLGVLAQELAGTPFEPALSIDEDSGYARVDYAMLDELLEAA